MLPPSTNIIQLLTMCASGSLSAFMDPHTVSVAIQIFTNSVILLLGTLELIVIALVKVIAQKTCGVSIPFNFGVCLRPLSVAMATAKSDRPGESENIEHMRMRQHHSSSGSPGDSYPVSAPATRSAQEDATVDSYSLEANGYGVEREHSSGPHRSASTVDGMTLKQFDQFDNLSDVSSDIMHPPERRNVYADIYMLGLAFFVVVYACDGSTQLSTYCFLITMTTLSLIHTNQTISNVMTALRQQRLSLETASTHRKVLTRRVFTVGIAGCNCLALFCYTASSGSSLFDDLVKGSVFDLVFAVVLPLMAPIMLSCVSPKQNPAQTIAECSPFVFTLATVAVLVFIASRGTIEAVVHSLSNFTDATRHGTVQEAQVAVHENRSSHAYGNATLIEEMMGWMYGSAKTSVTKAPGIPWLDIEIHTNSSIYFNADLSTTVDGWHNVPFLVLAPLIKLPAVVCILTSIVNRSHNIVITSLTLILTIRGIVDAFQETYGASGIGGGGGEGGGGTHSTSIAITALSFSTLSTLLCLTKNIVAMA